MHVFLGLYSDSTPPLNFPILLHVNGVLQKPHLYTYKATGCFNVIFFLKFTIFVIILEQQLYIVSMKVP